MSYPSKRSFDDVVLKADDFIVHRTESSAHSAENIDYDNATSGEAATTVQSAIDALYAAVGDVSDALDTINGESI